MSLAGRRCTVNGPFVIRYFGFVLVALAVATVSLSARTLAHETDQTTPDPGFRPDSDLTALFVDSLDSVTIAVYPTIVRRTRQDSAFFRVSGADHYLHQPEPTLHRRRQTLAHRPRPASRADRSGISLRATCNALAKHCRADTRMLITISSWHLFCPSVTRTFLASIATC